MVDPRSGAVVVRLGAPGDGDFDADDVEPLTWALAEMGRSWTAAQEDVKKHGALPVPMKLRNAPTKAMKEWALEYHEVDFTAPS